MKEKKWKEFEFFAKWVLSSSIKRFAWRYDFVNARVRKLTQKVTRLELEEKNEKDIWLIGGGKLIASFLENVLLDRMILTLIPKTIGKGIPLFPEIAKETSWILTNVERFETGVINLTYDFSIRKTLAVIKWITNEKYSNRNFD